MTDPNPAELQAMADASDRAGEYMGTMPTTDMARWTPEQWHTLIAVVCGGYVDSLMRQQVAAAEEANKAEAKWQMASDARAKVAA